VVVLQLEVVVDVTKLQRILFSAFLLLVTVHNTFAEMMKKGTTKVKTLFNVYHQNSTDGEQVYDNSGREEANVIEPMIFIEHQIDETTSINGQFVFDFWTAASDTKLDGMTGASGGDPIKAQSRISATVGVTKEVDKWTLSSGAGFSSEYDYKSINASLGIQRSFAKDNFTLALGIQYYADQIRLFNDITPATSANISDFVPRNILATSLTASQILTRKDIMQFGLTFARASKNLESTASTVKIANTREVERLPGSRSRYALSSTWVHGFNEKTSLNSSYRYYFDQWDLDAHTVRVALLREINDDEDFVELALRLHQQGRVRYYQDSFQVQKDFMTSDSDLDKFKSYEVSCLYTRNLDDDRFFGFELEDMTLSYGVTAAKRSTGLLYTYGQASLGFNF
jgi:hypothetical protein